MLSKSGFHELIHFIHCLFIQHMFLEPLHVLALCWARGFGIFATSLAVLGPKERA